MKKEGASFCIQLADKKILIEPRFGQIQDYCKKYIVRDVDNVDLMVQVNPEDIQYERICSKAESVKRGNFALDYPDSYLESLAIYRKIAEWMPLCGTILFHGSVVAVDGKAYLFTAPSGTGKSTHSRLWREYFGERAVMVNDDKPLLKITRDAVYACGTPWDGKHHLNTNIMVPLEAIYILKQAKENKREKIVPQQAYPMLFQQCYRPKSVEAMTKTLIMMDRLMEKVSVYRLECNVSKEAVMVAYEGINKRI